MSTAVVSACNSATRMASLSPVFDRFLRYHVLAESFRGQPVIGDQKLLFELVLVKDAKGAKTVICDHVISGVKHIRKSRNIL